MPSDAAPVVVVSNRGPGAGGAAVAAGGLVVALGPGVRRDGAVWVASGDEDGSGQTDGWRWRTVGLAPDDRAAFYDVVASGTLWYCLHGLWDRPRRPRFDRHWHQAWARARAAGAALARAAAEAATPGGVVLAQDYHLALADGIPGPGLRTSLFVHTPWCSPEELAVLPDVAVTDLLGGMAAYGSVGFHTRRWADAFLACCAAAGIDAPPVYVAPAATDEVELRATAAAPACDEAVARLDEAIGDRALLARVDRLELSKNLLRGFWAFDELLETRPEWRDRVVFAASGYPTRGGLADYLAYGQEVRTLVDHLNAKWGTPTWRPILLDTSDDRAVSLAALRRYDVLLVNPVRDGLNLVASEGPLLNERAGTLVLSREAGADALLGGHATTVNPFDVSATASAIAEALGRPDDARVPASAALRQAAGSVDPLAWWDAQLAAATDP